MAEHFTGLVHLEHHPDGLRLAPAATEAQRLANHGVLAALPETGAIRVTGDDADSFLHAQLTQGVARLELGQSVLAAWCSAKGRVLALLRAVRVEDGFLLLLPAERVAGVVKRLRLFVLRARVEIQDCSDSLAVLGVADTLEPRPQWTANPPLEADRAVISGDRAAIRLRDPRSRWLMVVPAEELNDTWAAFSETHAIVGPAAWRLLDIRAGLPDIGEATLERFVPQMLNLEPLGALAYDKGCYPGQEVVARMHYLGQLKRRLYRLAGEGSVPRPAEAVVDASGAGVGEVVQASADDAATFEALAVLRIDAAKRAQLHGNALQLLPLPYSPPDEGIPETG